MPEISRFYGITIMIYYNDHNPPHFHVKYEQFHARVSIKSLKLIGGHLPKRVLSMVLEWAFEHRAELLEVWELALKKEPLKRIAALE